MMSKESVEINTKINELYSKTIITQKFINESENPLELKIFTVSPFFYALAQPSPYFWKKFILLLDNYL